MNLLYIVILLLSIGVVYYLFFMKKAQSTLELQAVQNPKVYLNDKEILPKNAQDVTLIYQMDKIKSSDKLRVTAEFAWIGPQPDTPEPGPEAGYCSIRGVVDGKELPLGNLTYVTDGNFLGWKASTAPSLKANNQETQWMSNNFNAGWGTGPQGIDVVYNGSELA